MNYDWQDLAFGSKKPIRELKATFIAPPREISAKRFAELIKTFLPSGHIVLGLAKEKYVDGFNNQPQFKMLQSSDVTSIIRKVNASKSKYKIHTLALHQREVKYALEKLHFNRAVFINGSWKYVFHATDTFYTLIKFNIPYELVPAFTNEAEATEYAKAHVQKLAFKPGPYNEDEMMALADTVAELSYDNSFQTGALLGRKTRSGTYTYLTYGFNKVVPYQTYAMLHGSTRERHLSPANDLNYYDTIHAETALLLSALQKKIDLKKSTLFVNLLPCPNCARVISETDIAEIVYRIDHSDGYAVKLFEASHKKVRRLI